MYIVVYSSVSSYLKVYEDSGWLILDLLSYMHVHKMHVEQQWLTLLHGKTTSYNN